MAGDQAGEIEFAGAVEGPDHLAALPRRNVSHIGLVVFHAGKTQHCLGMFIQGFAGTDDELVEDLAVVVMDETNDLALPDLQPIRSETHLIGHADLDGAVDLTGIADDAPGLLFLDRCSGLMTLVRLAVGQRCRAAEQPDQGQNQ